MRLEAYRELMMAAGKLFLPEGTTPDLDDIDLYVIKGQLYCRCSLFNGHGRFLRLMLLGCQMVHESCTGLAVAEIMIHEDQGYMTMWACIERGYDE